MIVNDRSWYRHPAAWITGGVLALVVFAAVLSTDENATTETGLTAPKPAVSSSTTTTETTGQRRISKEDAVALCKAQVAADLGTRVADIDFSAKARREGKTWVVTGTADEYLAVHDWSCAVPRNTWTLDSETADVTKLKERPDPVLDVDEPEHPAGASAKCNDGTYSYSEHRRGTCSHHGGVETWLRDLPA